MNGLVLLLCIFGNLLTHGTEEQAESEDSQFDEALDHLTHMAMQKLFLEPPNSVISDPNTPFEKLYDDLICSDTPLFSGTVANMRECKQKCLSERSCRYMAFWVKSKKCENYMKCWSKQSPIDMRSNDRVSLYRRVSPCEVERDYYYEQMGKAFKPGFLRPLYMPFEWQKEQAPRSDYPNPNFNCECTGIVWMSCAIFLTVDSDEFPVVYKKFDPTENGEEGLLPFKITQSELADYGGEINILTFSDRRQGHSYVRAEIILPEYVVDYEMVMPGCIHISQCLRGTANGLCPVQNRPFVSGEPVYILKRDVLTSTGTNLPHFCISVKGLRSHMMLTVSKEQKGHFKDPMKRVVRDKKGGNIREELTVEKDYIMFWLFDDVAFATGICGVGFTRSAVAEGEGGGAGSSGSQPGPSQATQDLGVEGKKKKNKSKRGGKAHRKSGSAEPQSSGDAGSPSSPLQSRPASLPLFEQSSKSLSSVGRIRSEPASLDRLSGAGSSNLQSFSPDSPEAFSDSPRPPSDLHRSSSPDYPAPKPKVVLSNRDVEKLRRSFEQAKQRRSQGREEHVSSSEFQDITQEGSNDTVSHRFGVPFAAFVLFLFLPLFFVLRSKENSDAYFELLSHEQI